MTKARSTWFRRGAVASVVIHAVFALAVVRIAPERAAARAPEPTAIEVVVTHTAHAPPPAPPEVLPVREAPRMDRAAPAPQPTTAGTWAPREAHAVASHRAVARATAPAVVTALSGPPPEPGAFATVAPGSVPVEPAAPEESPGTRECAPGEGTFLVPIDPFSVAARALAESPDAGVPADDAGAHDRDGGVPMVAVGPRHSGRQADLEGALRSGVRGPDLSERPPPPMTRASDGGWDVQGNRLSAHVFPDGRIAFRDGPPIEDIGPQYTPGDRDAQTSGRIGVGFRFDLNDGLFGATGNDPLRTERQFLLRHTEALRNRLATRARRVDEERAILALDEELRAIAANRSLSPARRREEVFLLWDDCATDAIGTRARTLVEDFIRERFPAGTALAYTSAELTRDNARRATSLRFDPYRTQSPDGGA